MNTATNTDTATATETATETPTATATATQTSTATSTATPTSTHTATDTPTRTSTSTRTNTRTPTDTRTPTESRTPADTRTPTSTPAPPPACGAGPATGCKAAGKNVLRLKDSLEESEDRLNWIWTLGADTSLADLGEPRLRSSYTVCLYDASGLLMTLPVSYGSTWEVRVGTGFLYADRSAAADGLRKLALRAGAGGKAKVLVAGIGSSLPNPPLPLTAPVTIQLLNSEGVCWESSFEALDVLRNDVGHFRAKAQ